jgi:hypothetical protein
MVTAGAAGVVYIGGALLVAAFVDLRLRAHSHRRLRPAIVLTPRGDTPRSSAR